MAVKIDMLKLGSFVTRDEVEVEIRLEKGSGEFQASMGTERYTNSSLVELRKTLKARHRELHAPVKWIKVLRIVPKSCEVQVGYVARIGDAVQYNTVAGRTSTEVGAWRIPYAEREKAEFLPKYIDSSYVGDIAYVPYSEEVEASVRAGIARVQKALAPYRQAADRFINEVKNLAQA